ncbi:hypothetical protein [Caulobacter sp. 17J65-9]|uniref:hypothetical protein n=1 Tax=Caulobacter sp. 17J65-9 TaxID=2709382 RepID=UPI0013C7D24A|nr:hypothetical protein [Caulobacter sp. 17J65-9]NEX92848.1 hypothetical protein [Caulobacter sp. 17J65-9]
MRSFVFGLILGCVAATTVNAQVMPAVIGNAVSNAAAAQARCLKPEEMPQAQVEAMTADADRLTTKFRKALAQGDNRTLDRLTYGKVHVRWPDGSVIRAQKSPRAIAAVAGAEMELRRLVIAGDQFTARGLWKGVDASGADLWLTVDYASSQWTGRWKVGRMAFSTGAEPTLPDSFCHMSELGPLW